MTPDKKLYFRAVEPKDAPLLCEFRQKRQAQSADPLFAGTDFLAGMIESGEVLAFAASEADGELSAVCLLKAGFVPCGYFPSMKKHGGLRRDYVVFSRISAKISGNGGDSCNKTYLKYFTEYKKLLLSK